MYQFALWALNKSRLSVCDGPILFYWLRLLHLWHAEAPKVRMKPALSNSGMKKKKKRERKRKESNNKIVEQIFRTRA